MGDARQADRINARVSAEARTRGRSAAVTIGVVLSSLVAVAASLRLVSGGEALSHRVVVAARGCGGECDEVLARMLAKRLRALGFDAVAPQKGSPALGTPLATRRFAREHAARFAVSMVVSVEGRRELLEDGLTRVNANASMYVMDVQDEAAPSPAFVLNSVDEGQGEQAALRLLGQRFLGALLPGTASALLSSEPVTALQAEAANMEQQAAALAMKRHSKHLRARARAITEYRAHCEHNDALLRAHDGVCVSKGCSEEYLVGVLPSGRAAVIHDSSNLAVFPLTATPVARSVPTAERLWLVPLDQPATANGSAQRPRKLLAEASNFYSQPSLSLDGRSLAYVERRHGESRLYAGALEQTERAQIHRVKEPARLSKPHLSPDGGAVLYFELEHHGGRAWLLYSRVKGGAQPRRLLPHALDARWASLPLPAELGGGTRLLVAALVPGQSGHEEAVEELDPRDPPLPELWLMDPDTGQTLDRRATPAHHIRALGGVHDGALWVGFADTLEQRGRPACGVGLYHPGRPLTWQRTALCPKHLAASARGVFAHALQPEFVGASREVRQLVSLSDAGELRALTDSPHDLQRPKPAADAPVLAYEYVLPRKYGEFQDVAVCFRPIRAADPTQSETASPGVGSGVQVAPFFQ